MAVMKFGAQALIVGFTLLVAGCTSSDEPIKLKDGSMGYHIYCNGMPYRSKEDCLSRAETMCGDGGYTVLREADPVYAHSEDMWSLTTHDIFVRCNDAPKTQTFSQ